MLDHNSSGNNIYLAEKYKMTKIALTKNIEYDNEVSEFPQVVILEPGMIFEIINKAFRTVDCKEVLEGYWIKPKGRDEIKVFLSECKVVEDNSNAAKINKLNKLLKIIQSNARKPLTVGLMVVILLVLN